MYTYRAKVEKVVDGDTLDLLVDLGFHIHHNIRVRLLGVDCPETRKASDFEKSKGLEAKEFTKQYVEKAMTDYGYVIVSTESTDKYGRWLSYVSSPEEGAISLTESLVINNHTKDYMKEELENVKSNPRG